MYADAAEVCGAAGVDGVVLATPPWVTTGLAEQFLRAGQFVLAEKPIAVSTADARKLATLPDERQRRLQVGLTYRHDPALARLREWIRDGPLHGPLLIRAHIYDERLNAKDPDHSARIRQTLRHGPPVLHEGAHVFDWLAFLLDGASPRVSDAWSVRSDPGLASPNLNGARLTYRCGTNVLVEFGWLTSELPRCELSILGQHGYAVLDGFTFRLTLTADGETKVYDDPVDRTERCFDRQLGAFVDLVRGRSDRAVPGLPEGLAALDLSERIAATASMFTIPGRERT
ncbi:Predicted dehydrogenase [Actinopolymorpha cephalotaxi]|uniref:Predicted dehydrogenase n=1 Tax=Actinopolymorpha cephalotaxi TaxID=504797 RepID=A0A1I2S5P3_9ACTN|nr:Predicted dehydrogenase [Actinopolymorpha cephalotaxi]